MFHLKEKNPFLPLELGWKFSIILNRDTGLKGSSVSTNVMKIRGHRGEQDPFCTFFVVNATI